LVASVEQHKHSAWLLIVWLLKEGSQMSWSPPVPYSILHHLRLNRKKGEVAERCSLGPSKPGSVTSFAFGKISRTSKSRALVQNNMLLRHISGQQTAILTS